MRRMLAGMLLAFTLMPGMAVAQTAPDVAAAGLTGQSQSMGVANVEDHMGKDVIGSDEVRLGVVEDVVLDPDGGALQLVIATRGPHGVGERQVAITMSRVRTRSDSNALHLADMTEVDVAVLPEFVLDEDMRSLERRGRRGLVRGSGIAR